MANFSHPLKAWMAEHKVTALQLVDRLNALPGVRIKRRTRNEISRVLSGRARFIDPSLGDDLAVITGGAVNTAVLGAALAKHLLARKAGLEAAE